MEENEDKVDESAEIKRVESEIAECMELVQHRGYQLERNSWGVTADGKVRAHESCACAIGSVLIAAGQFEDGNELTGHCWSAGLLLGIEPWQVSEIVHGFDGPSYRTPTMAGVWYNVGQRLAARFGL